MAKTKTSSTVKNRYNAKAYDRLAVVVPKGKKEVLQVHADENMGESLNGLINRSITETVERDSRTQIFERMFGMKLISPKEYEVNLQDIHDQVLGLGDIVCIDGGEDARLVIMEEPQYQVMRDALKTIFAAASMDKQTMNAMVAAAEKAGIKSEQ